MPPACGVWWNPDSTNSATNLNPTFCWSSTFGVKLHWNSSGWGSSTYLLLLFLFFLFLFFLLLPHLEVNEANFRGFHWWNHPLSRLCPIPSSRNTKMPMVFREHVLKVAVTSSPWLLGFIWGLCCRVLAIIISYYNKDPYWPTNKMECHKVFVSTAQMVIPPKHQPTDPDSSNCQIAITSDQNFSKINLHL